MRYLKDCVTCPNCKKKKDAYIGTLEENLCDECEFLNPYDAGVPCWEMPWPEEVEGKERRVLIDSERQLVWEEIWSYSCQRIDNRKYRVTDGTHLSPAAQGYIKAAKRSWGL